MTSAKIPGIGASITLARIARNMTQGELADHLGVTRSWLSSIEREHGCPSIPLLTQIARALNTSASALLMLSKAVNDTLDAER